MSTSCTVHNSLDNENAPQAAIDPATRSTPPKSKKDDPLIKSTPISAKFASQEVNALDKGNRDTRLCRMAEEMTGKIVGPMPAQLFLNAFLPKTNVEMNASDLLHYRAEIQKLASTTVENTMYPIFVDAVQPLCPALHFRDTHTAEMKAFDEIIVRPDICAYTEPPGQNLNDPTRPELMEECKPKDSDDVFADQGHGQAKTFVRDTIKATELLGQITCYAAAHQSAQFRTHVFSLLVFPSFCRLLRWDRSGMVVTEKINLTDLLLPEFLHRYNYATPEQRGVDTSVTKPSSVHAAAARKALNLPANATLLQLSVSPDKGGYIVSRKTYMTAGKSPLGRSTKSYHAYSIDHKTVVFLKDVWRLASQTPEHEIYAELHKNGVPHLATVIDGADIMDHTTHTQDIIKEKPSWAVDPPKRLRKHIHYRLVLKEVASPLITFSSTKHLVQVIRQAIIAHQKAYKVAGILHRDISVNNVMIYNGDALLIDWDLSKSKNEDQAPREIERTGTWQFMAARLLLEDVTPEGPHNLTDDLESFVHLLTWMAFVYTTHNMVGSHRLARFLKDTYDDSYRERNGEYFGGEHKVDHLLNGRILKRAGFSNGNLLELLKKLTTIIAVRYQDDPNSPSYWGYSTVSDSTKKEIIDKYNDILNELSNSKWMIEVFDEYLSKDGWPENDAAVDNGLVGQPKVTTIVQSVNSGKRSQDDDNEGSRKKMKSSTSHPVSLDTVAESQFH